MTPIAHSGRIFKLSGPYGRVLRTLDRQKQKMLDTVEGYAPGVGQTTGELGSAFPATPGRAQIQPQPGGLLRLTEKGVSEDFAPDLSAAEQRSVFSSQIPLAAAGFKVKLSMAAWNIKPSWNIVSANDRIINPDLEKCMAKRMDAKMSEIPSSHVVMLSQPMR